MKFLCMDALNTSFQNEEFNVVLDKGTLDALMPDDGEETQKMIDKYFAEVKRVLKVSNKMKWTRKSITQLHSTNIT